MPPAKFPVLFMRAAGGHLTGMALWFGFNYRKARAQEGKVSGNPGRRRTVPLLGGDSHMTSFVFSGNNSLPATRMEPSSPIP